MPDAMIDAERRLRAARPWRADVDANAAERPEALAILAAARTRVPTSASAHLVRSPRRRPVRLLVRAGAVTAAAIVAGAVAGWPGSDGGPQDAVARPVALAMQWFDPAPGTILHARSTTESRGPNGERRQLIREFWQSVDQPGRVRTVIAEDGLRAESGADGLYDPRTDTVYLGTEGTPRALREALKRKVVTDKARAAGEETMREDATAPNGQKVAAPPETRPRAIR